MHTFRCTVKFGHQGSGKFSERDILVKARDAMSAMSIAKHRRGVKKGNLLRSGASVLKVIRVD